MVIWLVGLSGSGKTTIGRELYERWKSIAPATVLVDGDEIRRIFGRDTAPDHYTLEGRRRNAERIFEICRWLDRQGINVVCCILSIFTEMREQNRSSFTRYFEVFVDVPVERLISRDDKGIYGPAVAGQRANVVGVDIPFPRPATADLVLDNSGFDVAPSTFAAEILARAGIEEAGVRR